MQQARMSQTISGAVANNTSLDSHTNNNNPQVLGGGGIAIDQEYNPYMHGPSKGEFLKQQRIESIPKALPPPELIKVEAIPTKVVYDFTKRSANYRMVEEGIYDRFDCEERCDSKIKPEDLKKLEIELKKK